jgi:hypothetical protein
VRKKLKVKSCPSEPGARKKLLRWRLKNSLVKLKKRLKRKNNSPNKNLLRTLTMKNPPQKPKRKEKKTNVNIIIGLIIIMVIFISAGILFWYKYFRPEEKEFAREEYPLIEYEDVFEKAEELTTPSPSLFENCLPASTIEEYEDKKGNEIIGEIKNIKKPGYIQFPVTFHLVPVSTGFEQKIIDAVIKFNTEFCELTRNDWQVLVSPLSEENALDYLILRKVEMSPFEANQKIITILSKEEYEEVITKYNKKYNQNINPKKEPKISQVVEEKDRYIIDWAYYLPDKLEVKYERIVILKNGKIIE